jgi:uncharacterized protein YecE (DUF72 family)
LPTNAVPGALRLQNHRGRGGSLVPREVLVPALAARLGERVVLDALGFSSIDLIRRFSVGALLQFVADAADRGTIRVGRLTRAYGRDLFFAHKLTSIAGFDEGHLPTAGPVITDGGEPGAMTRSAKRPQVRVGCSGWNYRDWRGRVYPKDLATSAWFSAYAELFDTVEINNTFYRLPPPETMERWARQAPADFVYAVKLGQFGSHRMKLRDAERWLPNHVARVALLGRALGPTLVQLPPRWKRNTERLDEFLSHTPRRTRWAVELRDPTWLHDDTFEVLQKHGAALCIHDLLPDHPWILTAEWTYLRFHGPDPRHNKYWGAYTGRRLWRPAAKLCDWVAEGHDVYAYFNNDFEGHAVQDALWLRRRIAGY